MTYGRDTCILEARTIQKKLRSKINMDKYTEVYAWINIKEKEMIL